MTANVASRAVHAGGTLVRQVRSTLDPSTSQPAGGPHSGSGWLAVTVLCDVDDIDGDRLPAPLAEMGESIEVRIVPAAGGKGTELAARLQDGPERASVGRRLSGQDQESELRSALRGAKQLVEVGEVLAVDPTPHGHRTKTPGGVLLEAWTKAAAKGGVR